MRRGAIVRAGFFLVLTLALLATEVAGAAEGADFRLDLDAGGHTARITDLAFRGVTLACSDRIREQVARPVAGIESGLVDACVLADRTAADAGG